MDWIIAAVNLLINFPADTLFELFSHVKYGSSESQQLKNQKKNQLCEKVENVENKWQNIFYKHGPSYKLNFIQTNAIKNAYN